ncbi:glutathione S-transferase [Trichoderma austrokoningii]
MKLYIGNNTCARAAQLVANELGVKHELVFVDVFSKACSSGEEFSTINPLLYVPVLKLDNENHIISETVVISSYLADQHPESGMLPPPGTLERVKADQSLVQLTTEIAQKHIPLILKLMTEQGIYISSEKSHLTRYCKLIIEQCTQIYTSKLLKAYQLLDDRLADNRPYLFGDTFTVADAYVWGTFWNSRSGVNIQHMNNLTAWKARVDARPAAIKTLKEEAEIMAIHTAQIETRSG